MSGDEALRILVLLLILATSGLFSAAEISFLALGRHRADRVFPGIAGRMIGRLLARPAATLGAILVMITTLNYAAEAIAASSVITLLRLPLWTAIAAVSLLVILFAEVVPITYAAANVERVARASVLPVWIASGLVFLPARAIGSVAERLVGLLGGRPRPEPPVTEGEIRAIVDLQAESGGLQLEEQVMIHHIFEFGEKTAREVMVPRTRMVAVSDQGTVSEAGRLATENRVSRMPVYHEHTDDIVGAVHVKDLLPLLAADQRDPPVSQVMRPVFRVPETKRLADLLTDFRRYQRTFAVVVDEYGGTSGIVTLEDLLEEVVGDIYDEYDVVASPVQLLPNGAVVLDGGMSIEDASAAIGVALPRGDYTSLAGLIYSRLGAVPKLGQGVDLDGIRLVVQELDGHRISRVLALVRPESDTSPSAEGGVQDG